MTKPPSEARASGPKDNGRCRGLDRRASPFADRAAALIAGRAACARSRAETKLRVGKAQPNQFAFVPADIGVDTGIFKKHGLDVEISCVRRRRQA